jgi:hypothetical protein
VDILSMMGLEGCMAALGPDGSVLETHEGTFWLAPWPGLQPTVGDVFWEGSKLDNTLKLTVAACNCRGSWHPARASSSSDIQVEAVWTLGMRPADVPVRSGVLQSRVRRVLATVGQTSMWLQLDGPLCMRRRGPQGSPTSHPHSLMHACVVSMCGAPAALGMA